MDIFLSGLLLVGAVFFAFWLSAKNRNRDSETLDVEVSRDFEEEFKLKEPSAMDDSSPEVEDLVEWLEEDMRENQTEGGDTFEIR
jgi:hypothetical protein